MTKRHFEPVTLREATGKAKPLFVGRIADAMDFVVDSISLVIGTALILCSVGLAAYNLLSVIVALSGRGAWVAIFLIALAVLAATFLFWLASPTKRFAIVAGLVILSFMTSPIFERMLA